MDYGLAEIEIAEVINAKFDLLGLSTKFFAAPMPETDKDMKDFDKQATKTRCAVEYVDSTFDNPSALEGVRQGETAKFRLFFDGKRMRGDEGLHRMIAYVKKFLLGYRMADGDALTLSAFGKMQFDPGIWMPFLEFESKTMNMQVLEYNDAIGGNLQNVDTDQNQQFTQEFGPEVE